MGEVTEPTMITFSDEILNSNCLFCAECRDVLRPPIMLVENVGNTCFACHEEKHRDINRSLNNFALEKILLLLQLPCKYKEKGCNQRFQQPQLLIHQNECRFRTRFCSMLNLYGCDWEGNTIDFINHFKEYHGDHVINFENNMFFLETSLNELNLVKLLVTKCHSFILRMQTNLATNKLHYVICCVNDTHHSFDYSVKHKGSSSNYIKTKSKILHSHHDYDVFDEKVAVEVDLEALKQISHVSETITNVFKIKFDDPQVDGIDEKMLHFFECPVCKTFMKPPIYQCQSGHSICNNCRPRLEKCPTCRAVFGTTRNYSLEGLTSGVQYNCIYHDLGCPENAPSTQISKHEKECSFRPYNCPFQNCAVKGNHSSIISHLIECHGDNILYSSPGYRDSFRLDQNSCYRIIDRRYVIAFNHIFRLSCKRVAEHCLWAAEVFGCYDESKTFIYEVTIFDMRRPEKKLIKTDYCLTDVSEDDLFKRCVMFHNNVLSSYSGAGMITYLFTIKER